MLTFTKNNVIVTGVTVTSISIAKEKQMKHFYGRDNELNILNNMYSLCEKTAQMTVITGRRRIGKTALSLEYCKDKKFLYFFISKKSENLLCAEFIKTIKSFFDLSVIGEIRSFKDIFELILQLSVKRKFVLVIDEFQEFFNINPSMYSEIQGLWDLYKRKSKLHVIFIGSVYSLMQKIFQDSKEPLFGRADRIIYLKAFKPRTLKTILSDYKHYTAENLFYNYVITGGVPRYQEILVNNKCFSKKEILNFIFEKDSPFIEEGRNLLIEEFGKEYGTYFSILELLSGSKTSRAEIESVLQKNIGGYLERLEKDYDIIDKVKPIGSKPGGRIQKYKIKDNFLRFWFRFIYKNKSAVETENFTYLKSILKRDFNWFCGNALERLFHEIVAGMAQYNIIGNYWEKGNHNELDLVAINELEKKVLIGECKINSSKISIKKLEDKGKCLNKMLKGYEFKYTGFSIHDIDKYL